MAGARSKPATDALRDEHASIEAVRVRLEEELIGWTLAAAPGSAESLPSLRSAALNFDPPHRSIVEAIGAAADARMDTSPAATALRLAEDPLLKELCGIVNMTGREYLADLAGKASAIASQAKGRALIESKIRTHTETVTRRLRVEKEQELCAAINARSPDTGIIAAELVRLTAATAGNGPRIRLVPFDEITVGEARRDLVKGIIPRVGLTVVWGPPKCGKSFVVFDLAMHVALGRPYRGRRVHQGAVVYCAFEGQTGMEARVAAFRQRFMQEQRKAVPFYLEPVRLDLVADQVELVATVRTQLRDVSPVLVVLDTLNRSIRGSESDDRDMSAYVGAADAIREAFECAVVIVHHCGIDATRPRGHTSLSGAVEAQLAVKRDAADNIVVSLELAKDGPQGEQIVSSLEVIEVGTDEDGEKITSCVIVPSETTGGTGNKERVKGAAKLALLALQRAIEDEQIEAPANSHIPRTARTTTRAAWRRYSDQGTVTESEKPDSQRKAFVRACQSLQSAGVVGVWGDYAWLT